MGICAQQHRVVTGNNSCFYFKNITKKSVCDFDGCPTFRQLCVYVFSVSGLIMYMYTLCLIMGLMVDVSRSDNCRHISPHSTYNDTFSYLGTLIDFMLLYVIDIFSNSLMPNLHLIIKFPSKNYIKRAYKIYNKKFTFMSKLSHFYTLWLFSINLFLIVCVNPTILNPGPVKNTTPTNISVLYQNTQGLIPWGELGKPHPLLDHTKLLELQGYVYFNNIDIVILNETWITKAIKNNEIFPSNAYKIYRMDRSTLTHPPDPNNPKKYRRNGGGVLIAVKSDLDIKSKIIKTTCKAEVLALQLTFNNGKKICLSTCYRVGNLEDANHVEVDRYLKQIAKIKNLSSHVLVGDFNLPNISWPEGAPTGTLETKFMNTFEDVAFTQYISEPTHIYGNTLDLLLCDSQNFLTNINVHEHKHVCSSDHFAITFSLGYKVKRIKSPKRRIYNYKKANWNQINTELRQIKWDLILTDDTTTQRSWDIFKHYLFQICDKNIPKITVKSKFQPPWFDSNIHKIILKKERLRAKFKKSKDPLDYQKFKEARKFFKKSVQEKIKSSFNEDGDPSLIPKRFWNHVKATSNSTRIPECVSYGGRFRSKSLDQAELFNTYFYNQFSSPSKYDIPINYSGDQFSLFSKFEISISTIRTFIKNINVNKAPGPDGIHGKMLKNCAASIAYPLYIIFNKSFHTGFIPNDWKLANVVPVFKKGDKALVENYRPISLISLIMKVFEKCIRVELMASCSHLIDTKQHGFLPEKSCTTQMIHFIDNLALGIQEQGRNDVIYFDFAKAFDSVNHDVILHKLKYQFNIDGTMLNFLKSYLQNRKQCVVIEGAKSSTVNVNSGVPQGSIIGPLLFVLFINDMQACISPETNIALYADDTKIWRRINHHSDSEALQRDIDALYEWSIKNKMSFHPDKCKVLMVTNQLEKKYFVLPFDRYPYRLGQIYLDYVNSERDLGVIVNTHLSWHEHCSSLIVKANSRLGLTRRTCHFTKDHKQKRVLYLMLVRSIFEHCSVVWRPTSPAVLKRFESIQRRATKWIFSEPYVSYDDNDYLCKLKKLDYMPLGYKFLVNDLLFFHKIVYDNICTKFPSYLSLVVPQSEPSYRVRLRKRTPAWTSDVHPIFRCSLKPIEVDQYDPLIYKCSIKPRTKVNENTFFVRTYQEWNKLPLVIRTEEDISTYQHKLMNYIWEMLREEIGREKWPD